MFWAKHTFLLNSQGFAQLEHTFRCTWQRQTNPTCPPKIASITLSLSLATIFVISLHTEVSMLKINLLVFGLDWMPKTNYLSCGQPIAFCQSFFNLLKLSTPTSQAIARDYFSARKVQTHKHFSRIKFRTCRSHFICFIYY